MWWKPPWNAKGAAVMDVDGAMDALGIAEQDREAVRRRLELYDAALARSMGGMSVSQEAPGEVDIESIRDPGGPVPMHPTSVEKRADEVQYRLWTRLLTEAALSDMEADTDPAGGLYWNLHCLRCNGAEVEPYAPPGHKPGQPLEWRINPGPDYLGGVEEYQKDKEAWLKPYTERLVPLLRRIKTYAPKQEDQGRG